MAMTGEHVRYQDQLERLHESIERLARVAANGPLASEVEVMRPLPQDRLHNTVLGSKKYARYDTGQGFTLHEYITGDTGIGTSPRRFHVVRGPGHGIKGIVLPYMIAGQPNITKRHRVRPDTRPEDLAIALDGSGRSWAGIYLPHGRARSGSKPASGVALERIGAAKDELAKIGSGDLHGIPHDTAVMMHEAGIHEVADVPEQGSDEARELAGLLAAHRLTVGARPFAQDVPVFGVIEDAKTQPYGDNALENFNLVVPGTTTAERVIDKTQWLGQVQEQVDSLYQVALHI